LKFSMIYDIMLKSGPLSLARYPYPSCTMTTPERSCPINHDLMRHVYAEHGVAQAEMKSLIDPLAARLAEQVHVDTIDWDPVSNWESAQPVPLTTGLPYGEDLSADPYILPPHLFGRGASDTDFTITSDYDELTAQVRDFIKNRPRSADRDSLPGDDYLAQNVPSWLDEIRHRNIAIDPDKWTRYRAAADQQLQGEFYHIESAMINRKDSVRRLLAFNGAYVNHPDIRRFGTYMYATGDSLYDSSSEEYRYTATAFPVMPIGAYGQEFARNVLNTTQYTIERAKIVCSDLAQELGSSHEVVIETSMARGRDIAAGRILGTPGDALVDSLEEGVLSIMQTIALLTAERVPGYDDPNILLHDIIKNGLIEQFTRHVPMGLVGPFALAGCYFKEPLQLTEHGLRLDPELVATLKQFRYQQIAETVKEWDDYHNGKPMPRPDILGTICPGTNYAIPEVSQAMLAAFESIDKPAARRKRAGHILAAAAHSGVSAMAA